MSVPYVCQYCGLTTRPDNYHEGPGACQKAMREFTMMLRQFLPQAQPFTSAWEFDSFDMTVDAEDWWKVIADKVGVGPEFGQCEIFHANDRIYTRERRDV